MLSLFGEKLSAHFLAESARLLKSCDGSDEASPDLFVIIGINLSGHHAEPQRSHYAQFTNFLQHLLPSMQAARLVTINSNIELLFHLARSKIDNSLHLTSQDSSTDDIIL